jgi:hypothetical protein
LISKRVGAHRECFKRDAADLTQLHRTGDLVPVRTPNSVTERGLVGAIAYLAVMMVISVAAALVSWHSFEKHFLALKRHFPSAATGARPDSALRPDASLVAHPDEIASTLTV